MADEVLYNSPALHVLKRHQLMSLSKRYGLKASGKNVDMIDRLKKYAATLSPSRKMTVPLPAPTPGPLSDFAINQPFEAASPSSPQSPLLNPSLTLPPTTSTNDMDVEKRLSRMSENWEVLSESGASLISPAKSGMTKSSSVRSWKSANNGESLSEFGVEEVPSGSTRSKSSSIKALATSLSRRASHHLKTRSFSASSNLSKMCDAEEGTAKAEQEIDQESEERIQDVSTSPPSPASTVGVPRRHSRISLVERPSTIRLCSPAPQEEKATIDPVSQRRLIDNDADDLPFFTNGAPIKERKSMAPLRHPAGPEDRSGTAQLGRKSLPAISSCSSASVPSIYPPLPTIGTALTCDTEVPPVPPIPGAFQREPVPAQAPFGFAISNDAFADSSKAVLAQMQATMEARGINATFGEELLKGKKAEVRKLVSVNDRLGQGGWGLKAMPSTSSIADRYAQAHQREFARMRGIDGSKGAKGSKSTLASSTTNSDLTITPEEHLPPTTPGKRKISATAHNTPSAPNGLPLIGGPEGTLPKRRKLSIGPNTLGSIKGAGKSLVSLLGDGPKARVTPSKLKRRTSGGGLSSRFGLFKSKRCDSLTKPTASSFARSQMSRSTTTPSLTSSSRTSSMMRGSTSTNSTVTSTTTTNRTIKERTRATSAGTFGSTGSKTPTRPKLPDFGDFSLSRSGSINALNLPTVQSGSMSSVTSGLSMKKQSQVDLIRKARPAPAPPVARVAQPATGLASAGSKATSLATPAPKARTASSSTVASSTSTIPVSVKRSSTLYQPTASSLARMQATVKPPADRPLPAIPPPKQISTTKPFGNASSRFEASFNVQPPAPMPPTSAGSLSPAVKTASKTSLKPVTASPMRPTGKFTSSAGTRIRHKQSGLSAVKSKGNLRAESEVNARRADIRAKQARLGEERELRAMLGETSSAEMDVDA